MDNTFTVLAAAAVLDRDLATALDECGFVVMPGSIPPGQIPQLQVEYDAAVAGAIAADMAIGRTTTRVDDFVNRGPAFDPVYTFSPARSACCRIIGRTFRLSALGSAQ